MKRILVLCTGNSARSQLAQAYLQHFANTVDFVEQVEVYSAGVKPKGVNPLAIQVLAEDGIDGSHHTSNHADEYVHTINLFQLCNHHALTHRKRPG